VQSRQWIPGYKTLTEFAICPLHSAFYRFTSGFPVWFLPHLYYWHTTFENNHILPPNMTKITAADLMVGGCCYLFDILEFTISIRDITHQAVQG